MRDKKKGVARHIGSSAVIVAALLCSSTLWGAPPAAEDVPVPVCPPGAQCEPVSLEPPAELLKPRAPAEPPPDRELTEAEQEQLRRFDNRLSYQPYMEEYPAPDPLADRDSTASSMSFATAAGATLFGVTYLPFLIAGLVFSSSEDDDKDKDKAYLMVPIAGPAILAVDEEPSDPLIGLLVAASALQTIGSLMWIVGAATDSASKQASRGVSVVPAVAPNMAGVVLTATF